MTPETPPILDNTEPGFAATKQMKEALASPNSTDKATPIIGSKASYYSGFTTFSAKSVEIRLDHDNHFRAFTKNKATGNFNMPVLDISIKNTTRVFAQLTQLVINANGKTYRFELNGPWTTLSIVGGAIAGEVAGEVATEIVGEAVGEYAEAAGVIGGGLLLRNALKDNPVDTWLAALGSAGYPIKLDGMDTDVKRFFGPHYFMNLFKIFIVATILIIVVITGLYLFSIRESHNKDKQALQVRNNTHANPEINLQSYTNKELGFGMKIPNTYSALKATIEAPSYVVFALTISDTGSNPYDPNTISVTFKHQASKADAIKQADFVDYSKAIALSSAPIGTGDSATIKSHESIKAGGHIAVKSTIHITGRNTINNSPVDNTATIIRVYIDDLTQYTILFHCSTYNTHLLENIDPMLSTFTILR